jgi:hypothetical protein
MITYYRQFVKFIRDSISGTGDGISRRTYLLLANVFLIFFLILLNNFKIIPLRTGDFVFFALLTLALAMYRPGWVFLFFIGSIPLENINLAPESFGINVRPYQFLGALIILAILIRKLSGKLNFELQKLKWFDYLVIIMAAAGFLSAITSADRTYSLKLSIILTSFAALYFLVRNYIQNVDDLKRVVPFFISSSLVVIFYGIWQNIRFLHGLTNFEVMPGRPNATFTEADWLGIYVVLILSVILSIINYYSQNISSKKDTQITICQLPITMLFLFLFLTLSFILLIITVSRSAWLGAFATTFIFLFIYFTNLRFKNWHWLNTLKLKLGILSSLIIAILIIFVFHLTNFQLVSRAQSTGTGQQEITVSCVPCKQTGCDWKMFPLNEKVFISDTNKLEDYNCRHINLEEINDEMKRGNFISHVFRKDPNFNTRSEIYKKSWNEIKNHPVLGIGWGNIGKVLGADERGASLNSSNIFLEVWLGSGIIGFLCFIILLAQVLFKSMRNYYFSDSHTQKTASLFIIISWLGLVVANLFNAGIFLGFFWVWLGISILKNET